MVHVRPAAMRSTTFAGTVRDLEVAVLARAVHAQVEARVLVHGRRTVVFE